MTARRIVTLPRIVIALVVIGLVAFAAYLIRFPANQHEQTKQEQEQLELALEKLQGVSAASVNTVIGSASIDLDVEVTSEQQYLDLVVEVVGTWEKSPLSDRKSLSLTASPEGEVRFANVDSDTLDRALDAARVAYALGADEAVMLEEGLQVAGELRLTVFVADESLVEPTLAELTALVAEAGLLHRPDGLSVSVGTAEQLAG